VTNQSAVERRRVTSGLVATRATRPTLDETNFQR